MDLILRKLPQLARSLARSQLFWYPIKAPPLANRLAPIHLFSPKYNISHIIISMEKKAAASSRTLCHFLTLAKLVGFLILDSILIWFTRLHKFSSRIHTKERKKNTLNKAKEDQELKREDVEIVMERLDMPFSRSNDKNKDCMGFDELSTIFEEEEPRLEEVKEAFGVFDENCDGFIDAVELQRVLCKLGFRQGENLNACQEMIKKYDDNKDGNIDFTEFARFMESSFC